MSEIKRVALNSFEPQKVSDKVNRKLSKTIRISVILPESNEDKCPEYNYKEQLALTKKRVRPTKEKDVNPQENGLDPFGEDDDDVKRIALEMEAKYGTAMIGKKRKGRKDDYADIGMGYDESDSFIDNTDGYDEIIPQNVTTLHGGFYINSGALEFKTDDEASQEAFSSSSENENDERPTPHRKRVIESSDESDTASTSQVEKKPKISTKNNMQLAIKKQLFSQNKIQIKKRRQGLPFKKTVKDLIREKSDNQEVVIPSEKKLGEESVEKKPLKENKKPPSITSHNVQTVEPDYDKNQNKQNVDINKNGDASDSKTANTDATMSVEGESSQEGNKGEKFELVALPENLPSEILEIVNKIKQAAIDYKGEKKIKFFTDSVNILLLSLERKCKILGKSSRVKVYEHLAYYIKCRKETLIRRAKVLVQEDEEKRLERLTKRLKDIIDQAMVPLLANYEIESQKVLQKKFSKESVENEENKALKLPRRRFIWNDEARKLLKDIMFLKKKILILEGKQKDNLEEQIVLYLRTKILPLWPEGWMYISNLKKVFNSMNDSSKGSDRSLSNSASNSPLQSKHSTISISPLTNSKEGSNKPNHSKVDSVKSYSKSSKPANSNVAPSTFTDKNSAKKNEIKLNKSYNDLLESIKKDFLKTAEPKKSGKAEESGRVDNCYVDQHKEKAVAADSKHNRPSEKLQIPSDLSKQKQIDKVHAPSDMSKQKQIDKVHAPSDMSKQKQIDKVHAPSDMSKQKHIDKVHAPSDLSKQKQIDKAHTPSDLSKQKQIDKIHAPSDLTKHKQSEKSHVASDVPKHKQSDKVHVSSDSSKHRPSDKVHVPSDLTKHRPSEKVHVSSDPSKHKQSEKPHVPSNYTKHDEAAKLKTSNDVATDYSKHAKQPEVMNLSLENSCHKQSQNDVKKHIDRTSSSSDRDSSKHEAKRPTSIDSNDALKHMRHNDVLKLPADSSVIVVNTRQSKEDVATSEGVPQPKDAHCQVMDLTEKSKARPHDARPFTFGGQESSRTDFIAGASDRFTTSPPFIHEVMKNVIKPIVMDVPSTSAHKVTKTSDMFSNSPPFYAEAKKNSSLSISMDVPSVSAHKANKSEGDDIQMVMENLKALQKLSASPVKSDTSTSSPVSVIAFNKNFSSKSNPGQNAQQQRIDKAEFPTGFQDEFQKQFIHSLQQMSANAAASSKSNYRCS